jgi:tetratricopeptide (TPR) repeat protein
MRYVSRHRPTPGILVVLAAVVVSACAHGIPEVSPADIPAIQSRIAANPENTDLQVQLGMAQFKAEDYGMAVTTLQGAVDAGNQTGAAYLYLGMTHERMEDWSAARDAYGTYLEVGRSDPLKDEVRKRLELIAQNLLRQQAAQALAQEAQISSEPPTPRSLAVLPFGFNSDREDLEPLIYALSDMMITDFAVSNALTVLERSQIQSLLDEMALTEAGYAEPATGARAGRMLRAEHVVQGVLTPLGQESLRLDTDILNIARAASAGSISAEDELQNLFDMEKDLVFRTLREVLNVELTPAEEQQIRENRAQNILAFLAYGRGLRARDQGDYAGALAAFQQAQQLDPGFDAAATAVSSTTDISSAASSDAGSLGQTASNTGEVGTRTVAPPPASGVGTNVGGTGSTTSSTAGTLNGAADGVDPSPTAGTLDLGSTTTSGETTPTSTGERDPVQESQGQEGVTKTAKAQIRIVIKRPGGGGD